MYCVNCGKKNENNTKFCVNCGNKFSSEQQNNTAKNNSSNQKILIGIVLAIVIILFILLSDNKKGPENTVKNYINYAIQGNINRVIEYSDFSSNDYYDDYKNRIDYAEEICDSLNATFNYKIIRTDYRTNTNAVITVLFTAGFDQENLIFYVNKINNKWLINVSRTFGDWGW